MKVSELINKLSSLDQNLEVVIARFVPNGNFCSAEYDSVQEKQILVIPIENLNQHYTRQNVVTLNGKDWA